MNIALPAPGPRKRRNMSRSESILGSRCRHFDRERRTYVVVLYIRENTLAAGPLLDSDEILMVIKISYRLFYSDFW